MDYNAAFVNQSGTVMVYKAVDRVDFPAGIKHSAKFGPTGCCMIVGVKE